MNEIEPDWVLEGLGVLRRELPDCKVECFQKDGAWFFVVKKEWGNEWYECAAQVWGGGENYVTLLKEAIEGVKYDDKSNM
jgi:hypothetical protein